MRSRDLFEQIYREMVSGRINATENADAQPRAGGRYQSVSDQTVIERVLQLANMQDWRDFIGVHAAFGQSGGTVEYAADADALPSLMVSFTDTEVGKKWHELYGPTFMEYQREQEELVAVLEAIRNDLGGSRARLARKLSGRLEQIIVVTIPEFRAGQLLLEPYPFFPNIRAAWAYGAALLLDEKRPGGEKRSFGERLRRCALGEDEGDGHRCGKWFLSYASATGGPLPKYCSTECRNRAAEIAGVKRVQKHRASKSTRPAARKSKRH